MIYQENPRKMFQMRTQSQIAFQDVGLIEGVFTWPVHIC